MIKRNNIIIANWKMNLLPEEEAGLARQVVKAQGKYSNKVDVVLCPSHVGLCQVDEQLRKFPVKLGAQDVAVEKQGALTGEVSAMMIKEAGAEYCIIGHSERRRSLKETDDMVNKKLHNLLIEGVTPILCIGETYDQRSSGKSELVVLNQLKTALKQVSGEIPIIVTYEPVWAISPNGPATPEQVAPMVDLIYQALIDMLPQNLVEENIRIIYGGSVDGGNVKDYLKIPRVEGALVGAASLDVEKFTKIIKSST